MTYKIIRIDGENDELTVQNFDNYSVFILSVD